MIYGMVFPGQGSQSVGMLHDLKDEAPIKNTFDEASEVLAYDLWDVIQAGPEAKLNETIYTQLAMLTADVALYRLTQQHQLFQNQGMMAGHSLGEYAALVCSGVLQFKDAIALVKQRATLMQQAVPLGQGAMAAIVGLEDAVVEALCQECSTATSVVSPANYNAIGQVVVAGETAAVERLIKLAESKEARLAKLIPVSVPCHCDLLKKASEAFGQALQETPFSSPACQVLSNVDAKPYQDAAHMRMQLQQQLYRPVQWVQTIQAMAKHVQTFVECGPGQVLAGLVKRIDRDVPVINFNSKERLQQALASRENGV